RSRAPRAGLRSRAHAARLVREHPDRPARDPRRPRGEPDLRAGLRRPERAGDPGPRASDPRRRGRVRARGRSRLGAGARRSPRRPLRDDRAGRPLAAPRAAGGPRARGPRPGGGRMSFSGQIAIAGVHEYEPRYAPDKTELLIMAECAREALADAGLRLSDVDGLFGASMT